MANVMGGIPLSNRHDNKPTKLSGTIVKNDDLIITKSSNPKTVQNSKNGRYISRITDAIDKLHKREQFTNEEEMSLHLMLYWDVRKNMMINKYIDNAEVKNKYNEWYGLVQKFDVTGEDYNHYMQYLERQLNEYIVPNFDTLGIQNDNFMRKNYDTYDLYGLSTFMTDEFINNDKLILDKSAKDSDRPELNLPDIENYDVKEFSGTIPKIIHIVYYKRKIDMVHIYKHLSTYTSNRDYKIIIWMFSFPKDGIKSGENVEFKLFNDLKDVNETFDYTFDESDNLENEPEFEEHIKYKLKYYILKKYGGIYTDYSTYGVKKINDNLISNNFVSVFETKLKDMQYICPIGVFMGFVPNHPYVNYIIDNFDIGCKECGAEYIYLRSALIKHSDSEIKLLYQNINSDSNESYVKLYPDIKNIDYFGYKDFEKTPQDNSPNNSTDNSTDNSPDNSTDNSVDESSDNSADELLVDELDEINELASNALESRSAKKSGNSGSYSMLFVFLIGLLIAWFYKH